MRSEPRYTPAVSPSGGLSARVTASGAEIKAQDVQGAPVGPEGPSRDSGGCRPVYCVGGPCADTCLRSDDPNPIDMPDEHRQRVVARIREAVEGLVAAERPAIPLRRAPKVYRDGSAPTVQELALYAEACGVTVDWLLTGIKEGAGARVDAPQPASEVRDVQAATDAAGGRTELRDRLDAALSPWQYEDTVDRVMTVVGPELTRHEMRVEQLEEQLQAATRGEASDSGYYRALYALHDALGIDLTSAQHRAIDRFRDAVIRATRR